MAACVLTIWKKLIECNPDVIVLSSAIFKDPEGPAAGVARCPQGNR